MGILKMEHSAQLSITAIALLLVVWHSESILATETNNCSCYSFQRVKRNWENGNNYCIQMKGKLVSMETEEEYQFINKSIQSENVGNNEWYIGLTRKTGDWRWISGHSMTIDKWRPGTPYGDGDCVKMIKDYKGLGLFDDVECTSHYMIICEYNQAQSCSSINNKWCFSRAKLQTTKETPTILTSTSAANTQRTHSYSSTSNDRKFTIRNTTKQKGDANTNGSNPSTLVTVTVALGVVLVVSICLLVFVFYWKRRNKGKENEKKISETTSLPRDATIQLSNNNQGHEGGDLTEGVQLFHQGGGESDAAYAVIHNNLTQQNQSQTSSSEPAYASVVDENVIKKSSKNDANAALPAATMNVENSGNSVGDGKSNTEAVYATVDKSKKNNIKTESQDGNQWATGPHLVYASVDKSNKTKARSEDELYEI